MAARDKAFRRIVRRGFLLVLFVLCVAALLVYGIPYVAERTGYAYEAGRARGDAEHGRGGGAEAPERGRRHQHRADHGQENDDEGVDARPRRELARPPRGAGMKPSAIR